MEQRYRRLFSLKNNLYCPGASIVIESGALLEDSQTERLLILLKMKSISLKPILAITVRIMCFDTVNEQIGEEIKYDYLDLKLERDQVCGQKTPILVLDRNVRSFKVLIEKVVFSDNGTWSFEGGRMEEIPISEFSEEPELMKQYRIDYGDQAKYTPVESSDIWVCACGGINHENEAVCHTCNASRELLLSCDLDKLCAERDQRQEIERKKRKRLSIAIWSVLLCLFFSMVAFPNVKMTRMYTQANALLEKGEYDSAIKMYRKVGDYKDSRKNLCEAYYGKAKNLLLNGKKSRALLIFKKLGNYKDSKKYLKRYSKTKITAKTIEEKLQGEWDQVDGTGSVIFHNRSIDFKQGLVRLSGVYSVNTKKSVIDAKMFTSDGNLLIHLPYSYSNGVLKLMNNRGQSFVKN